MIGIQLKEWEKIDYRDRPELRRRELSESARSLAERLETFIRVEEFRQGIRIQSTSFVGRVELGELTVTVVPKISGSDLVRLFAYAYDLEDLELFDDTTFGNSDTLFVDIVVRRLITEVRRLRERGLHRTYVRIAEDLRSPRGAIDMRQMVRKLANGGERISCVHYPRDEDHVLNRVIKAGLLIAARAASNGMIRVAAARAAAVLESVIAVPLSNAIFVRARRAMDRRLSHYKSALNLVEILWNGTSLDLEDNADRVVIPGFLFDMNRFWQLLLGRLLRENLGNEDVIEDRAIRGALRYVPSFEHPRFRTPTARPDFIVKGDSGRRWIVDAKYRDLWQEKLPRAMLYQLATYASIQGPRGVAAILYPAYAPDAREVRVEICSPEADGAGRASVVMRPVHVSRLVRIVSGPTTQHDRKAWVRALVGLPPDA